MTKTVVHEDKAQGVVVTENVKGFPVTKEMWRTMNEGECPKTNGIHFMERGPTVLSKEVLTVRQTCLKAAVEIVTRMPLSVQPTPDAVSVIAEEFEKWILRK